MGCHCLRDKEPLITTAPRVSEANSKEIDQESPSEQTEKREIKEEKKKLPHSVTALAVPERVKSKKTSPRSVRNRVNIDSLEVKLRDIRLVSEVIYQEINGEGDVRLGQMIGTGRKCWVQRYALERSDRKARKNMQLKAGLVRTLDHEYVLRVLDIFQQGDLFHVLYEVTQGGSMQSLCSAEWSEGISEQWAVAIMRQMLAAVSHCHSKGVVLKTLTPKQLLFQETPTKNSTWVKLMVAVEDLNGTDTQFMAPEVLAKSSYIGPENDLYSIGRILSLLLIGDAPPQRTEKGKPFKNLTASFHRWNSLNQDIKDLISALLSRDFRKRPSIESCLNHPLLSGLHSVPELTPCLRTALRNMAATRPFSPLKHALYQLLVNLVASYESLRSSQEAFLHFDTNSSGSVSHTEIRSLLFRLFPMEKAQAALIAITNAVLPPNGELSYTEFLLYSSGNTLISSANLISAFHLLELNDDGVITTTQLKEVLTLKPEEYAADWQKLLADIDSNASGAIVYEEFCEFMRRK